MGTAAMQVPSPPRNTSKPLVRPLNPATIMAVWERARPAMIGTSEMQAFNERGRKNEARTAAPFRIAFGFKQRISISIDSLLLTYDVLRYGGFCWMFAPDAALEPCGPASRRSRRPSLASRVSLPDIFTKPQYKCIPSQGVLQIFSLKGACASLCIVGIMRLRRFESRIACARRLGRLQRQVAAHERQSTTQEGGSTYAR